VSLDLKNLDERTRRFMLEEVERDIVAGKLFLSDRLTDSGKKDYPDLLREAIQGGGDEGTLAKNLRGQGRLKLTEDKISKKGRPYVSKVPENAAETLAEGEFNRFYARGLCRRAIEDGIGNLVVYRAKEVDNPRPDSASKIDQQISASKLLEDLRINIGVDPALGLPSGPNSGLSVRLP
jgi:hypothetical protein